MTDTISHKTTCVMDCPDTCALEVEVTDGRVSKITGSKDHPDTDGFICGKVSNFSKRLYHEDRLLYPMKRTGPKGGTSFERISWEEATAIIVARFREVIEQHGGESILPYHYGGSNGFLSDDFMDRAFFACLGASRLAKTICAAPTSAVAGGMYGHMPGVAFGDYVSAKFILIWGANPKGSNIHLIPYLKEAKQRGAFIAVVDPINRFSDREIDLHLGLRPGTDLVLALALIRHWKRNGDLDRDFMAKHAINEQTLLDKAEDWPIERAAAVCGIPEQAILLLAQKYAAASPAMLRCGWGLERNVNGGQAAAAVVAMPTLLGKFGIRAGGYTMSNSKATHGAPASVLGDIPWNTRELNMTRLAPILDGEADPAIKATFVYNCNPIATVPEQDRLIRGFLREDLFTVVFDQVLTDTASYADILLPATTFLEAHDIRGGYGSYVVGGAVPVITPAGEARSNLEVFSMLARAMGFTDEPFSWDTETCFEKVAGALRLNETPCDPEVLKRGENQSHVFADGTPVQFKTVFPGTADGKVNLTPAELGDRPYRFESVDRPDFPLALISPASSKLVTSTFGEFNLQRLLVTMNPVDAAARDLSNNGRVSVYNDLGEVICHVKVSAKIAAGVVLIPKGAWRKSSLNRMTSTALCPATINVVAGGACFSDARVEVRKAPG